MLHNETQKGITFENGLITKMIFENFIEILLTFFLNVWFSTTSGSDTPVPFPGYIFEKKIALNRLLNSNDYL